MKLSEIHNCKIILTDNISLLKEKKISLNNSIILTLIGNEEKNNKISNFYNLINKEIHLKYEILSKEIIEKYHDSLNIDLALKKNIARIFYGQIGLFPYYDLIKKLLDNKNELFVHTEEKKIFDLFKDLSNFNRVNIFYYKKNTNTSYFKISKIDLLKMFSINEIFFYIKKKFFPQFKRLIKLNKNVFIHLSTERNFLLLDRFLNSKWQSKLLEIDSNESEKLNLEDNQMLITINKSTELIIKNYFDGNKFFKKIIDTELNEFFQKYFSCYKKIEKKFENLNSNFYFLTKIIRGPLSASLYDYGKKNNKSFFWISHQHGHGIELSDIHKKTQITKEETMADLLFVYSSASAKIRRENKFINKKINITSIGYHNNNYLVKGIPKHDVIYISNLNQELNGHEINMSSINNFEKIKFEEKLITEVFSKINHRVLFKEYPGGKSSNLKNEHIKDLITKYKNITYFNEWLNAENIYKESSVIITSLPTSGLAGAIKSKKPLIFIDIRKIMPLRKNLIEIFKKNYFYLNYEESIITNLRKVLSDDLIKIKSNWNNKRNIFDTNFEEDYINIEDQKNVVKNVKTELCNFVNTNKNLN